MKKAFTLAEILIVITISILCVAIIITSVSQSQQEQNKQKLEQRKRTEEQNRIKKDKLEQETLQKEYLTQIQPLNFTISPWQYNREQEFSVFILYDINNKKEYLVVKSGINTNTPSISITPRIPINKE